MYNSPLAAARNFLPLLFIGGVGWLSTLNRALAIVVLAIDPNLLYLIGEPDDPA